jgi:hypothetical protein
VPPVNCATRSTPIRWTASVTVESDRTSRAPASGETEPAPERSRPARAPVAPLEPLGENERPTALLVAIAVCAVVAVVVLVGGLTVHDLSRHGGSLPGAIFLAGILVTLGVGMYRRRYLAVLAFEALLTFQIIVTSLALVIATSWVTAGLCVLAVGLAGWLFWKLVRIMGRIQAGEQGRNPHLDQ